MSDEAQRQFFYPTLPTQSTTPGIGVTMLATSTSAAVFDLNDYPHMFGKFLDFYAEGGKIWISSSADGTPDISKSTTPGASIAAGTVEAACVPIASGNCATALLTRTKNRYLHVQADSGTPTLIITPSSQKETA